MIYFDCASTVKPYDECLDTFVKVSKDDFANSASTHFLGLNSHHKLEQARKQIAKYLNVLKEEVIFTSGASEANNLAIKGVSYHNASWAKRVITSKAEHPSVLEVFSHLEKEGFEVVYLDYDKEGRVDFNQLANALNEKTSLVSLMMVNNETGYIFDVKRAFELVKKTKAIFHIDGTQAIGKESLKGIPYDLFSFSGHKIGGLKGSGALIKKSYVQLDCQILGGGQENNYRSGTSALGLDCSLATAIRLSFETLEQRRKNAFLISSRIKEGLQKISEVELISKENCTPFIISFALKEHKASVIAQDLSQKGICVSTKSACSSRSEGYSYVLYNAGYPLDIASNAIRLSFSGTETVEMADEFLTQLKDSLDKTIKRG